MFAPIDSFKDQTNRVFNQIITIILKCVRSLLLKTLNECFRIKMIRDSRLCMFFGLLFLFSEPIYWEHFLFDCFLEVSSLYGYSLHKCIICILALFYPIHFRRIGSFGYKSKKWIFWIVIQKTITYKKITRQHNILAS